MALSEHPPVPGRECYEAVWSQGRACKNCPVSACYRQGWDKSSVDADNRAIVDGRKVWPKDA